MAGNEEIEECVRAEYARLVGVVTFVTGSRAKAEDAVQEAFAKAWERTSKGERFDHLAAWVVTVALNHARSGRRREVVGAAGGRTARRPDPCRSRSRDVDDAMVVRVRIRRSLARRQRDCVVLYYFLDLDVATVAQVLGISEGTVKSALARARSKLAVAARRTSLGGVMDNDTIDSRPARRPARNGRDSGRGVRRRGRGRAGRVATPAPDRGGR